jgi:aliphatic sulfonates family ABC transporter substrate-binding protein
VLLRHEYVRLQLSVAGQVERGVLTLSFFRCAGCFADSALFSAESGIKILNDICRNLKKENMKTKRNFWKWISAATVLTLGATLAGCGGNAGNNESNGNTSTQNGDAQSALPEKITIGLNPTIAQPQPLLGFVLGEYQKRLPGVKFEFKAFKAGPATIEALRSGVIDIGCSGVYPPLKAYAKDGDVLLLAGAAKGGTELMVAGNSPVKTIKDLKGKVVGVNQLGSTVDTMVRYNLLQAGLIPEKDVRIIPVEPAAQAEELERGQVAAVAAPAPWNAVVKAAGGRAILDWKTILDDGNYHAGTFFATRKFANANPEFIKKFLQVNQEITDAINQDRKKYEPLIVQSWQKVSNKRLKPEVAKAAFETLNFTLEATPEELQRFADVAFQTGALKKKADLSGFVFQAP